MNDSDNENLLKLKNLTNTLNKRDNIVNLELNKAAESLHIVNKDAIILWASDKEMKSLGYEPNDYIGETIINFHIDRIVIDDILEQLLDGCELTNYPARLKAKNGEEKHFLINSCGFFQGGEFSQTRCFSRDVTGLFDLTEKINENISRIKLKNNG
jgi:hypothetical protein